MFCYSPCETPNALKTLSDKAGVGVCICQFCSNGSDIVRNAAFCLCIHIIQAGENLFYLVQPVFQLCDSLRHHIHVLGATLIPLLKSGISDRGMEIVDDLSWEVVCRLFGFRQCLFNFNDAKMSHADRDLRPKGFH